ncbi:HTH domain-containing protein [Cronobacter malonaticus]
MRFPSQRLSRLFDLLQNETLPQDELARRLNVTTRTVRADISALNTLLCQHGVQLVLNRGSGYQLTVDDM